MSISLREEKALIVAPRQADYHAAAASGIFSATKGVTAYAIH